MYEDSVVCLCVRVAKIRECAAEIDIPYTPPLLRAIDALLESEDVAVGNVETGGCLHVDFFFEVGVEVGGFDVHLMDFKILLGCEREDGAERGKFGDGSKRLVEVDALDLGKTLSDDPSLIFLNASVGATLDAENPFASDNLPSFRLGDDVVDI